IRTVALGDIEAAILELAQTDTLCSAQCPHCGALNIFTATSDIHGVHLRQVRRRRIRLARSAVRALGRLRAAIRAAGLMFRSTRVSARRIPTGTIGSPASAYFSLCA